MGDFFKQLGRGNIVRPSVGLDVDLRQPTPEQQLRMQEYRNRLAEEQKQRAAIAAAGAAAAPRPQTYSIPVPGEPNMTPKDALGPITGDAQSGYSMSVTRSGMPSYSDMVERLPPTLDPETRFMAMTALEKFAKPGADAPVPADVDRERRVASVMTLRPDLSKAEASAAVEQGQAPPIVSAEKKAENQAEKEVRSALAAKTIIDPTTGSSANPSTPGGALAIANYAEEKGARSVAEHFRNRASTFRQIKDYQRQQAAEAQVPELEASLRQAINQGRYTTDQQGQIQAVIAQLHADPEKGIPAARAALHTITTETVQANAETRRRNAEARRLRDEESRETARRISSDDLHKLRTQALTAGPGGKEARSQLSAYRADLTAARNGLQASLRQLIDPTVKDADLGMTSEERSAAKERVRASLAENQRKIEMIPELRAEGGAKVPGPAPAPAQAPQYRWTPDRGIQPIAR